jgi:hypothetical protein
VLLIIGLALIAVGISDFVVARILIRQQTATTGGLGGAAAPPPAVRILRGTGALTLVVGVVLTIIALVS